MRQNLCIKHKCEGKNNQAGRLIPVVQGILQYRGTKAWIWNFWNKNCNIFKERLCAYFEVYHCLEPDLVDSFFYLRKWRKLCLQVYWKAMGQCTFSNMHYDIRHQKMLWYNKPVKASTLNIVVGPYIYNHCTTQCLLLLMFIQDIQ